MIGTSIYLYSDGALGRNNAMKSKLRIAATLLGIETKRRRLRGMPGNWQVVVPPTALRGMRSHRLLR